MVNNCVNQWPNGSRSWDNTSYPPLSGPPIVPYVDVKIDQEKMQKDLEAILKGVGLGDFVPSGHKGFFVKES